MTQIVYFAEVLSGSQKQILFELLPKLYPLMQSGRKVVLSISRILSTNFNLISYPESDAIIVSSFFFTYFNFKCLTFSKCTSIQKMICLFILWEKVVFALFAKLAKLCKLGFNAYILQANKYSNRGEENQASHSIQKNANCRHV